MLHFARVTRVKHQTHSHIHTHRHILIRVYFQSVSFAQLITENIYQTHQTQISIHVLQRKKNVTEEYDDDDDEDGNYFVVVDAIRLFCFVCSFSVYYDEQQQQQETRTEKESVNINSPN